MKPDKFTDNVVYTDDESSVHTSEDNGYYKKPPMLEIQNQNHFLIFDPTKATHNNPMLSQKSVKHKSCHRSRFNKYLNKRSKVLPQRSFLINPHTITTARLNGEMLFSNNYNNCNVSIVGEYQSTNGDCLKSIFLSCDKKLFRVQQINNKHDYNCKYVQIKGYHTCNGLIEEKIYSEWGNNFNMDNWNNFIKLIPMFPNMF